MSSLEEDILCKILCKMQIVKDMKTAVYPFMYTYPQYEFCGIMDSNVSWLQALQDEYLRLVQESYKTSRDTIRSNTKRTRLKSEFIVDLY